MASHAGSRPGPYKVSVDQHRETGVQTFAFGPFVVRYLFARSKDSVESGEPGQDYIAIQYDDRSLVFALCDGVSQSFYGDLAARFLGDALVDWLWKRLPAGEFHVEAIRRMLMECLSSLVPEATQAVQSIPIPPDAPPMLRDVLEQKRAIGSETTFACGAIEMPSPSQPEGRIVLAWMGNSELQLWGRDHDRTRELDAVWDDRYRWSTKVGPKGGEVGIFVGTLRDVRRVLAYSDGIVSLRERLGRGLDDAALKEEAQRLGETPASDDISFLEVELQPEQVPETVLLALPVPATFQVRATEDRIGATWATVPGAEQYEVEWTKPSGEQETFVVGKTWWTHPGSEGEHALRVRALAQGRVGEWSSIRSVTVPARAAEVPQPPPPPRHPKRWIWMVGGLAALFFLMICGGVLLWSSTSGTGPLAALLRTATPKFTAMTTHTPTPTAAATEIPALIPTLTSTEPPTPTPLPIATPTCPPTATQPAPVPGWLPESPLPTPPPYALPEFPPPVRPVADEEAIPENAVVAVGGPLLACGAQGICEMRIARQDVSGAAVRFRQPASPVSPDTVRWVWIVYPADHPTTSAEPISPLLVMVEARDGTRALWGEAKLQDGQATWVYGIDSPGGLGTFVQGLPGTGEAVLVRGVWRLDRGTWIVEVIEGGLYRFSQGMNVYVREPPTPPPTWTPRP